MLLQEGVGCNQPLRVKLGEPVLCDPLVEPLRRTPCNHDSLRSEIDD